MSEKIFPVILAGGAGTRLWPVSRDGLPKQFMPLLGNTSMFQQALSHLDDSELFAPPIVITVAEFRFCVQRQAEEAGYKIELIVEPERRGFAAAIAVGAMIARQRDPGATVLAFPADQVILDVDLFHLACTAARDAAHAGHIASFGVKASEPRPGCGYILPGSRLGIEGVSTIGNYVEETDATTAAHLLNAGYLRNTGNFVFRAALLEQELLHCEPTLVQAASAAIERSTRDLDAMRLDADAYRHAPKILFDHVVMSTDRAAVVEGRFHWSDVESWEAIYAITRCEGSGNAARGQVAMLDVENSLIYSEDRLTAVIGVKDIAIISTADAVLVVPRQRTEDVMRLVASLKDTARNGATNHHRVHRPWGYFDTVDSGDRFQVKRIVVAQGGKLSLQKHLHRAEHWVVVRGTAEVIIANETKTVHENESVYVPIGTVHRLSNPGRIPLEIIEVQSGSYLGEDDILRLDDVYRRDAANSVPARPARPDPNPAQASTPPPAALSSR